MSVGNKPIQSHGILKQQTLINTQQEVDEREAQLDCTKAVTYINSHFCCLAALIQRT